MSPIVFLNPLAGKAKRIDEMAPATKMQAILYRWKGKQVQVFGSTFNI